MRDWLSMVPGMLLLGLCIFFPGQLLAKDDSLGKVKVGAVEVLIVADCTRELDNKLFLAKDPAQAEAVTAIYPEGKSRFSMNAFLVKSAGRLILVDTGCGTLLGPDCGKMIQILAEAGINPEQITDVIVTHVHRDHIGGMEAAGKAAFPAATVHISKTEYDFWTNPDNEAKTGERAKVNFENVKRIFPLYQGKIKTFEPGKELLPGITTMAAHGHTPGQVVVLVSSGGENLLLIADVMHAIALQLARPDIAIAFDSDPVAAVATRKALLAQIVKENWPFSGPHVPAPAVYRIKPKGEGYELVK